MKLAGFLRVIEKEDLERIHDASMEILESTGVIFQSEEAIEIFKKNGAKVEGQTVFITRKMVEDCLATVPKSFKWYGTNENNVVLVGEGQERTIITPNNGCVYIQDIEKGKRHGSMKDLDNVYKLCHSYDFVDVIGAVPVHPCDLPDEEKYLRITHSLLKNTDRPLIGSTWNPYQHKKIFEMIEIAAGKEGYLDSHPTIGVSINPLSPLKFDDRGCEAIIEYSKKGQPIFVLSCAMSGVSAPLSIMGTAVLINSEMLAGMVLNQIIRPGNPFLYSPASSPANMQKGSYITGSPEANMINIACIQLAREIYKIPTRSMAGLTDAKVVDAQSGYETMQNLFQLMCAGTNVINECLGVMDSIMTLSYEKFILDAEMISRILRFMKGMDTSDKALSIKEIQKVGHGGSYLTQKSTIKGCRGLWTPEVSDWNSYSEWEGLGSVGVEVNANRKYKELLEKAPEMVIDKAVNEDLEKFIELNLGYSLS